MLETKHTNVTDRRTFIFPCRPNGQLSTVVLYRQSKETIDIEMYQCLLQNPVSNEPFLDYEEKKEEI